MADDRTDRRTPARDTPRQPDISYPTGSLDHPRIIIPGTGNAGDKPISFLSALKGYVSALLTAQKSSPGDGLVNNVQRVYETLPGPILTGQRNHAASGIVSLYREWKDVAGAHQGEANTEITPIDANTSEVRVEDPPSDEDILSSAIFGPGVTSVQFPRVLTGIKVTFNKSVGSGSNSNPAGAAACTGTSGGLNFSPSSSSQGSAAIVADVQPIFAADMPDSNVPSIEGHFFMRSTGADIATGAEVLTRLTAIIGSTVLWWPKFRPVPIILAVTGQHVSISCSASSHHSDSWSAAHRSASVNKGNGSSRENGVTINSVVIAPSIHADFNLTSAIGTISGDSLTYTATATASATANLPAITGGGDAPTFLSVENTTDTVVSGFHTPLSATATASVSPRSIIATDPAVIPITGLYLKNFSFSPAEWDGWIAVHVEIINFDYFAP